MFKNYFFICFSCNIMLKKITIDSVVYCNPLNFPFSAISNFTKCHVNYFDFYEYKKLVDFIEFIFKKKSIPFLVSHQDILLPRLLYQKFLLYFIRSKCSISCTSHSRKNHELLALHNLI